jgi:hypothetical protein
MRMDRVLKETEVKERFAERDIRAKVGSDADGTRTRDPRRDKLNCGPTS